MYFLAVTTKYRGKNGIDCFNRTEAFEATTRFKTKPECWQSVENNDNCHWPREIWVGYHWGLWHGPPLKLCFLGLQRQLPLLPLWSSPALGSLSTSWFWSSTSSTSSWWRRPPSRPHSRAWIGRVLGLWSSPRWCSSSGSPVHHRGGGDNDFV